MFSILVFRDKSCLLFTVFIFLKTVLVFIQDFQKFINHLAEADSSLFDTHPGKNHWVVPPGNNFFFVVLYKRMQHL